MKALHIDSNQKRALTSGKVIESHDILDTEGAVSHLTKIGNVGGNNKMIPRLGRRGVLSFCVVWLFVLFFEAPRVIRDVMLCTLPIKRWLGLHEAYHRPGYTWHVHM